ncbi:MAG: tape measure protein [Bacteroidota bacterium]
MALADITVRIGASIKGLKSGLKNAERALKRYGAKFEAIGKDLTTRVSLPIIGIGAAAVKSFGDLDRLEKAFVAVADKSLDVKNELKELQEAAKAPGLGFEQAVLGSIRLQAVKFSAEQARATLSEFGNAIASSGGTAQDLDEVTNQLTQIVSKGKILREDFKVLQNRVPLVNKALRDAFGTDNIDKIRDAGVSAKEFVGEIVIALSELPRVSGGISNAFVNLQNTTKIALGTVGKEIVDILNLNERVNQLADFITRVADGFKNLSPGMKQFIVIGGGIVAAMGPILLGLGSLLKLLPLIKAGFLLLISPITSIVKLLPLLKVGFLALATPVGAIVGVLTALGTAFVIARNKSDSFRRTTNGIANVLFELGRIIKEVAFQFSQGLAKVFDGDFKGGVKDLVESVNKGTFGLFFNSGKRLGDAYAEGYTREVTKKLKEEAPKEIEAALPKVDIKGIFKDFKGASSISFGASSLSFFVTSLV